jgi:hypothetical protein
MGGKGTIYGGGDETYKKKKGSDDDVTVGITDVLFEHVTLLLVAWSRVCWRAFVSTVKKLKVDVLQIYSAKGGCYNDSTQPVGVLVTLWTCVRKYLVRISAATTANRIHFSGFPNSLHINAGIIFRLGHNHFLPNPLQFVIYLSSSYRRFLVVLFVYAIISELSSAIDE